MRAAYLAGGPEHGTILTAEHLGSLSIPNGYIDLEISSSTPGTSWQDANVVIFVHSSIPAGIDRQTAAAMGRAELVMKYPHLR